MDNDLRAGAVDSLVSVLYVSSATAGFTDEQLIDFLRSWRDYNTQHQITGFLLYERGNFMQVLEGPQSSVNELVKAIQVDSRHTGMIILWRKAIAEREFGTWCMGFRKMSELSSEDQATFSSLLEDVRQDEKFRNHPGSSHKMLAQFKGICLPQYRL